MALEGTHIKFALDTKDYYKPGDIAGYLSGSIYPDSRYVTGIGRELTHFAELKNIDERETDDFKKGWACHFVCDHIMRSVMEDLFQDLLKKDGSNKDWIIRTALKILVDIDVMKQFSVDVYLDLFQVRPRPHGENPVLLSRYYMVIRKAYEGKKEITLADCMETWQGLNVGVEVCDALSAQATVCLSDQNIVERARGMYPEMLKRFGVLKHFVLS
ncbi:MAG: hypothetical protein HYY51_00080 [Candidatus Magasanikbacteria bacterium]|nr:hypothetical protein [Candidatus Magasanikbacteria bacterium]